MYTGIVRYVVRVTRYEREGHLAHYALRLDHEALDKLQPGDSIAVDGVCQSVRAIAGNEVLLDAGRETLALTTLADLTVGDLVHLERSARVGQEQGGQGISGHVDGTAIVCSVDRDGPTATLVLELPETLRRYVFRKGFIAVHGCSLTVNEYDVDSGRFSVGLVPETLRLTTFATKQPNDRLNIEIDRQSQVIVDTIERVLARMLPSLR
jgi:riboflavin synthase